MKSPNVAELSSLSTQKLPYALKSYPTFKYGSLKYIVILIHFLLSTFEFPEDL